MSAKNGGRGTPPVPPEGHGPPQRMEIPITKTIIQPSKGTTAEVIEEKDGEGNVIKRLHITFITLEAAGAVENTFIVEADGQKNILDAMTGGIQLADGFDLSKIAGEGAKKG